MYGYILGEWVVFFPIICGRLAVHSHVCNVELIKMIGFFIDRPLLVNIM